MRIIVSLIGVLSSLFLQASSFAYPDFMASMTRGNRNAEQRYKRLNQEIVTAFENMYLQNIQTEGTSSKPRIPKVIHQIWLGSSVPEKYYSWMAAWASLAGWEYRLWTDAEVASLKLHNQDLYDNASNFGEKSDILRLEILQKYGGLYVDVDFECINEAIFSHLHSQYDLYMGFEPLQHGVLEGKQIFKLCNALIASIPQHPLIKHLIVNLRANYLAYKPFSGAFQRTGPAYISRIVSEYALRNLDHYRNMYLPATFFYPFAEGEIRTLQKKLIWPETAAIHYWSGSWFKKSNAEYLYIYKEEE